MSLLIIDLGSSSVRALLFSDDARLIDGAISSRRHDFAIDSDGKAVADADALTRLTEACIDDILGHRSAASIRAVGMASFAGNWLGVDADGKACTPLMTYADTRARVVIPELKARLDDEEAYHQATGCFMHPAYLPAQFNWLVRNDPAAARRIHRISDIGGYVYRKWFGRDIPLSYSIASWSGLLHTAELAWHGEYARSLCGEALRDKLPRLADFDAAQVGLRDDYHRRWKSLRDAPFFLALGDGAVANVGSGAVDKRHIALTIGTTSALRVVKEIETLPYGLWRYIVRESLPMIGGAASEGGNVFQWAVEELGVDESGLNQSLAQRQPDQHGLTALPLIAGERSPGWQPDASGTIHGIRRNTSKLDILHAHLEAVAIRLSLIYQRLCEPGMAVMAGGGALDASPIWARMIADAFDAPLNLLAETEITARGVALLLREALDGAPIDADVPRIKQVIYPDPAHVPAYQAARERQLDLYRRLYG